MEVVAAAQAPGAFLVATDGRGLRNVSLAITMPITAHSRASGISWVPISPLSSGPTSATGAGNPERGGGCADGLGVSAGIEGNSAPTGGLGVSAGMDGNSAPTGGLGVSAGINGNARINGNSAPTFNRVVGVTGPPVTSGSDAG